MVAAMQMEPANRIAIGTIVASKTACFTKHALPSAACATASASARPRLCRRRAVLLWARSSSHRTDSSELSSELLAPPSPAG